MYRIILITSKEGYHYKVQQKSIFGFWYNPRLFQPHHFFKRYKTMQVAIEDIWFKKSQKQKKKKQVVYTTKEGLCT